ncbi:MAG: hypothetical protein P4L56_25110 [Candidatus Sulfopaludibacter sp.]|nr:hypothetical protein [Candidatus Sulfopaludibacter sp.]
MALRFGMRVLDATLTTFSSLKVQIRLENTGTEAIEIPTPDDITGALSIAVYYPGGKLLRSMNGFTMQSMQSSARVDAAYDLAPIEPGEPWRWTLDLAKYHYTLPEGEFEVEGIFEYPPLNVYLRSDRRSIRVSAPKLRAIQAFEDNPVLDRLELLMNVGSNGSGACYLRQHTGRPLAADYCEAIQIPPGGTAFCATANFYQTASFDPVAKRWLVWTDGADLRAIELRSGVPTGGERRAPLPEQRTPLRSAYYTEDDRLFVFLRAGSGEIECWELAPLLFERAFAHTLSAGRAEDALVRADSEAIHIVVPARGLIYERLSLSGDLLGSRRLFRNRMKPCLWQFDAVERLALAVFQDAPHGRAAEICSHDFRTGARRSLALDTLGLRSPIREWSVVQDRRGRFHILVSTTQNRLYYFRDGKGPILVAAGEERFLPMVIARGGLFLGCYRKAFGYRFLTLSHASYQPKFVQFEEAP